MRNRRKKKKKKKNRTSQRRTSRRQLVHNRRRYYTYQPKVITKNQDDRLNLTLIQLIGRVPFQNTERQNVLINRFPSPVNPLLFLLPFLGLGTIGLLSTCVDKTFNFIVPYYILRRLLSGFSGVNLAGGSGGFFSTNGNGVVSFPTFNITVDPVSHIAGPTQTVMVDDNEVLNNGQNQDTESEADNNNNNSNVANQNQNDGMISQNGNGIKSTQSFNLGTTNFFF